MQDLKFFTLLRSLRKKEELESFRRYLKSLHGNEHIALALFDYIRKFYPDYRDDKKLDIAYAYWKIFQSEIGENRKKILNTLSDLHSWLKDFLLSEKMAEDSPESQLWWLMVLKERELQAEFSRQASRLRSKMNALLKKNPLDYLKEVAVSYYIHCHLEQDEFLPEENVETGLDLFYALAKMKLACEKANFKNLRPEAIELDRLPPVFDFISEQTIAQHPLLLLYKEVYWLIATHRDGSFDRLETMLPEYADKIDSIELNLILRYLHNYATSQIREGKDEYWIRVHHLNKFSLAQGISIREGVIRGAEFNNIVSAACNANDVAWADSFVHKYSPFLPNDVRSEVVLLADATILFEKKDFKKILEGLEKKEKDFRNTSNIIRSKALIIRSYYELDKDEVWERCHTFDTFLHRHRKPKTEAVEGSLNFSKILKSLIRKKMDKERILEEIHATKPLYFKSWLLEKTNGYKKI